MTKSCVKFSEKVGRTTIHNWCSNFYVEPDGSSVESEFQAAKFIMFGNPFTANAVLKMPPAKAKYWGRRKIELDTRQQAVWSRTRRNVMIELLRKKFDDWPELANLLLATHDGLIVEENWWHDDEWGHCICKKHYWQIGKNYLGKALMEIRAELGGPAEPAPRTWSNFYG